DGGHWKPYTGLGVSFRPPPCYWKKSSTSLGTSTGISSACSSRPIEEAIMAGFTSAQDTQEVPAQRTLPPLDGWGGPFRPRVRDVSLPRGGRAVRPRPGTCRPQAGGGHLSTPYPLSR